jgi:RNA polymerase sigma factor (sigma-70 family)
MEDKMEEQLKKIDPYIQKMAWKYARYGGDVNDLLQAGRESAIMGIKKYKEGTADLRTYLYQWINGAMIKELKQTKNIEYTDDIEISDEGAEAEDLKTNVSYGNVSRLLQMIPPIQSRILIRVCGIDCEPVSIKEAGKEYGLSYHATQYHLKKAKKNLRSLLLGI